MRAATGLREDFGGAALRRLAQAEIFDGASRSDAARIGGAGLQIEKDWVVRFDARGPDGLLDGKAPGKRSVLNDAQRRALVEIVKSGPIPAIHGVVRWRLIDLMRWLHEECAVSLDETTVGRAPRKLGHVKLTACPRHHAQNEYAMDDFKRGARSRAGKGQSHPPRAARR